MVTVEFIADIGANHDGNLERAVNLIHLAARSGATVAKFQHFQADTIVSDEGFKALPKLAHQKAWDASVVEVYRNASVPWDWTPILWGACQDAGVEFLSTPYSLEAVDHLDKYVKRWKIGSGDITYRDLLRRVGITDKPILLATGASDGAEVGAALEVLRGVGCKTWENLTVMQCNTDYSGGAVANTNLRVLAQRHTQVGLSDHTKSLPVVLGAVALGASVIERHFTDDNTRKGPDHGFAMMPDEWRAMVDATRELESALGDGIKKVEPNEREARIVQRRCWRAARDLPAGHVIASGDVVALRPCPDGAVSPMENVIGRRIGHRMATGDAMTQRHIDAEAAA